MLWCSRSTGLKYYCYIICECYGGSDKCSVVDDLSQGLDILNNKIICISI